MELPGGAEPGAAFLPVSAAFILLLQRLQSDAAASTARLGGHPGWGCWGRWGLGG